VLERAFEPLQSQPRRSGLGLYVCHRIVAGLGGQINAGRTKAGGNRFLITLPVNAPAEVVSLPHQLLNSDRVARVLVVDDEGLPRGFKVLAQRGIPGFEVTRFRVIRDENTGVTTRDRNTDSYPPTEQIYRVGTGPELAADGALPRNDPHPEYIADEILVATQGPGIEGTREERTAGRTGTYGWTEREHMLSTAGSAVSSDLANNAALAAQ